LLCFHAYYKNSKYWPAGDKEAPTAFQESIRTMMRQVNTTLDRGENTNNWNIQKFHEILHLTKQITEYGNVCNTDAGFGERGLKSWAKRPGRRALKGSTDVFTESTVKRVREHVCLRKAAHKVCEKENAYELDGYNSDDSDFSTSPSDFRHDVVSSSEESEADGNYRDVLLETSNCFVNRHKFLVECEISSNPCEVTVSVTTMPYVQTKVPLELSQDVLDILDAEYYGGVNDEMNTLSKRVIPVYTEIKLANKQILRAHPNYCGAGPIYDFAVIPADNWEDTQQDDILKTKHEYPTESHTDSHISNLFPNHAPCRLLAFYKDPIDGVPKALVHRCARRTDWNIKRDSVLIESWTLEAETHKLYKGQDGALYEKKPSGSGYHEVICLRPTYRTVPITAIKCGIWAVPDTDIFADFQPIRKDSFHIMVVKDRASFWADEWFTWSD
jgi:hypothetical protein